MVQGGVLILAVVFSFVNLGVDLLYAFVDPRIKSQYKGAKKNRKAAEEEQEEDEEDLEEEV